MHVYTHVCGRAHLNVYVCTHSRVHMSACMCGRAYEHVMHSLWRWGVTYSFEDVSHETPDGTPCHTSPPQGVCANTRMWGAYVVRKLEHVLTTVLLNTRNQRWVKRFGSSQKKTRVSPSWHMFSIQPCRADKKIGTHIRPCAKSGLRCFTYRGSPHAIDVPECADIFWSHVWSHVLFKEKE